MKLETLLKSFKNQKYNEQLKSIPRKLEVEHDEESETSKITIYGPIGAYYYDGVSAKDVDKALKSAGNNDVIVKVNSPGGDAFDGIAIYNCFKQHPGKVTMHVDGWACSAASVIAMAADKLIMELGSMMMIHEASSIVWGTKTEMRKESDVLEELEEGMIDIYKTKSTLSREEVRDKVDAETWMSAKKAVEYGFADEATGASDDEPEVEEVEAKVMRGLSEEDKRSIINELREILQPDDSPPKQNKLNLLKNWRA